MAIPPRPLPSDIQEAAALIFRYGTELTVSGEKRDWWFLLESLLPGHFFEGLRIPKPRPFNATRPRAGKLDSLASLTPEEHREYQQATDDLAAIRIKFDKLRREESEAKATHRRLLEVARIGALQAELEQRKRRLNNPAGAVAAKRQHTSTEGNTVPLPSISQYAAPAPSAPAPPPITTLVPATAPTPAKAIPSTSALQVCAVIVSSEEVAAAERAAKLDEEERALLDTPTRSTRSKRDKGKAVRPSIAELFHEGRHSSSSSSGRKSRSTTSSTRSRERYLSPFSRAKKAVDDKVKADLVTEILSTSLQLTTPKKKRPNRIVSPPPSPPSA